MIYRSDVVEVHHPPFYVYELNNALYVVVRGSKCVEDYLTDVEMMEKTTEYGVFHTGFYNASMYVLDQIENIIKSYNGPVYFIGHSYGASVADILLVITRTKYPDRDLNAIGFAPVPAISTELSHIHWEKIVSFRNDADLVPTLSVPNICKTLSVLNPFLRWAAPETIVNALNGIIDIVEYTGGFLPAEFWDTLKKDVPGLVDDLQGYVKGEERFIRWPPGETYEIGHSKVRKLEDCLINAEEKLDRLIITPWGCMEHDYPKYAAAVEALLDDAI